MEEPAKPRISDTLSRQLKAHVAVEPWVIALFWGLYALRRFGEETSAVAWLVLAVIMTALMGSVIVGKLRLVSILRARGVEVRAQVLSTRYAPNLTRTMFARGKYLVKVKFPAGAGEQEAEVLCDRKPATPSINLIYDPLKPTRVWSLGMSE